MIRLVVIGLLVFFAAIYPFVVYFGLNHWHWELRYISLLLITVITVRLLLSYSKQSKTQSFMQLLFILFLVIAALFDSEIGLLYYPVIVSAAMFLLFFYSLLFPPSMIEKVTRLIEKDLSRLAIDYTRKVTIVWAIFFFCNGLVAFYTAMFCDYKTWALYNGFISYAVIAMIFMIEYPFRLYIKKIDKQNYCNYCE